MLQWEAVAEADHHLEAEEWEEYHRQHQPDHPLLGLETEAEAEAVA